MSTSEIEAAKQRAREAAAEVERIESEAISTSAELAFTRGVDVAKERKAAMVKQRAAALHAKNAAEKAQQEVKDLVEAEKKRLQDLVWALDKEMAPLREKVARMQDGIHALNIYLGRDEEIIPVITDGERAAADTPITVRQLVLAMDEESIIAADGEGMDFTNVDDFVAWLASAPTHVEQVIPDRKGVVAIIPRRAPKKYEDPWMDKTAAEENRRTFWLIRNGDLLWMTTTDFTVGNRVVPSDREFTGLFESRVFDWNTREYVTKPLQPGTEAWEKAEKASDLRTRHYMKVALLLEGLAERTTVLHPNTGVSFLDQRHYDDGRVRIIMDAENAISMGRPSFKDWQRDKMNAMREGMRIVGAFASRMRTYSTKDESSHTRPNGATPSNDEIYVVKEHEDTWNGWRWAFTFTRHDANIWDDDLREFRSPKTKGTGYLTGHEEWVVPLDLVTIEEIDYYLNSRTERHAYLNMIPTLRAARAILVAERESEEPFRTALIGSLTKQGADIDDAPSLADDLIRWFKTANKWNRALESKDTNASRVILAEAKRRRGESSGAVLEILRKAHPTAVAIARRTSDIVVAERTVRRYENEPTNIFVTLYTYGLRGALKKTDEWQTLRRSQVARWTIMHSTDEWAAQVFDVKPNELVTDELVDEVVEFAKAKYVTLVRVAIRPDGSGADAYVLDEPGVDIPRYYRHSQDAGDGKIKHAFIAIERSKHGARLATEGVAGSSRDLGRKTKSSDRVAWEDSKLIAINDERNAAEDREREAHRAQTHQIIGYIGQLESIWNDQRDSEEFARFMEDFGDESLWEGHRKTMKSRKSAPLPSRYDMQQRGGHWWKPTGLLGALEAIIVRGDSPAGRTVREIVIDEGFEAHKIDDSILDLRFPITEPSSDEDERL